MITEIYYSDLMGILGQQHHMQNLIYFLTVHLGCGGRYQEDAVFPRTEKVCLPLSLTLFLLFCGRQFSLQKLSNFSFPKACCKICLPFLGMENSLFPIYFCKKVSKYIQRNISTGVCASRLSIPHRPNSSSPTKKKIIIMGY